MDEVIKIKNSSYTKYEELLLTKESLQKEAFQYERAYVKEFGDLILDVFRKKIECIRKKKTIEYCQAARNHSKIIDKEKLLKYLEKEMSAFQKQLDEMVTDAEAAKKSKTISEVDLLTIKRIYRKLAKVLHPDINPITNKTPALLELWQRVQIAYKCNDKEEMQELELLAHSILKKYGVDTIEISIPDIDEKILKIEDEIMTIRETDPYLYKDILNDKKAVNEKKSDLKMELESYEDYSSQLDEILNGLVENGVSFVWQMN